MKKKLKVGILFGGQSGEHEVSIVSARSINEKLDASKYEILPIAIGRNGSWLSPRDSKKYLATADATSIKYFSHPLKTTKALASLKASKKPFDVIFPIIHGTTGEDGKIQGLLELAGIPYVGSEVLGSAIGMDKVVQKQLFMNIGIPTVPFLSFTHTDWQYHKNILLLSIKKDISYPCFVKPVNLGSSVGISKVQRPTTIINAVKQALEYDNKIIVERAVNQPREFECAILGNEQPRASVIGEIIPGNDYYDYHAKYVSTDSQTIVPAKIIKSLQHNIRSMALLAFATINALGMARVDFLYATRSKKLYLNEINTMPGFTNISMYSKLWQASGVPYQQLLDSLIDLALKRHKQKQRLTTKMKTQSWHRSS